MGGSGLATATKSHRPHPGVWMGSSRCRGTWLEPRETLGFGPLWPALVVQTSLFFQGPDHFRTLSTNYPAVPVARPRGKWSPKDRGKACFQFSIFYSTYIRSYQHSLRVLSWIKEEWSEDVFAFMTLQIKCYFLKVVDSQFLLKKCLLPTEIFLKSNTISDSVHKIG